MPPQNSGWLDEHQRRAPAAPRSGQEDPKYPVGAPEARTPDSALQGSQLLAQRDVLKDQFVMSAARQGEGSGEKENQL
jgi:hypothetical protein